MKSSLICCILLAVGTAAVPLTGPHHYYNGLNRAYYNPYNQYQYSPYGQHYRPYSYGYGYGYGGYPGGYQDYDGDGVVDDTVDDYNDYGYPLGGQYVQSPLISKQYLGTVPAGQTVSTLYQTHPSPYGYGGAGYYKK